MNWIRKTKRLAIYQRDGLACCYCGAGVEDGAQLTLDHLKPYSRGGNNAATNLVTCCQRCNSARGNRAVKTFAAAVAQYLDIDTTDITRHIANARRRVLDLDAARETITRRGSWAAAING